MDEAGEKFDAASARIKQMESLLAEKKALYQEYRKARKDMVDLGTARQNIERSLNIHQPNERSRNTQR